MVLTISVIKVVLYADTRFLKGVHHEKIGRVLGEESFRFFVNYKHTIEVMIAAGKYGMKSHAITAGHFPIRNEGIVEVEGRYFKFDRNMSTKEVISAIKSADTENPWSPGKVEHILMVGSTFPKDQLEFTIIGLGSVIEIDGRSNMPYIGVSDMERVLGLHYCSKGGWNQNHRFLAVREIS